MNYKKFVYCLCLIALVLSTFVVPRANAKPPYCDVALQGCYGDCDSHFGGYASVLAGYCKAGCEIGYLTCGV